MSDIRQNYSIRIQSRRVALTTGLATMLFCAAAPALADTVPVGVNIMKAPPPGQPVQLIAWLNDYSYLQDPKNRTGAGWERLSYIPLGNDPSHFLSIGGEARYYAQYWEHVTLGVRPDDRNDSVEQRLRLYGDLHWGPNLRAFVELGDNWEFGAEFPTPNNFDSVDVSQAFLDLSFNAGGNRFTFRPGRFQMPLGNGIMMGTRDGTNVRYTYNGLRAWMTTVGGNRLDVFAVRPMAVGRGSFDNDDDNSRDFSGAYFAHPTGKGSGVDVYFYNMGHDRVEFPGLIGAQRRQSYGARMFGKPGHWDYDLEGVLQRGRYAGEDIRAWGVISNGGFTFSNTRFTPRLGARFNAFSGDDEPGRGRLGTFEAPFPRTALHTDAGLFVFMNLVNFAPSIAFQFTPKVRFSAGLDFLWRESTQDAIYYGGSGRPLATPTTRDRHVATSVDLQLDYQVNRNLNFHLFTSHIEAGSALLAAGGATTDYVGIWGQYRF
ncbi:alginate export family protein [Stenotrophomonas tumulicola]|uniref:Alginate export family protein n=1 Tax=Stenotrophomonas tumulicola TaxID=1685415 RepID=A0A7W3FP04_9GAMM|nr:alginate export family protein [Stenotrophomonas tumulicola]MBA8682722.1 alginate export family protein [Stenotrophomonas tumulicola]